MDASSPVGKMLTALKQQLKARRITYREVAARLEVSEATIKRYFGGKGITVEILEKLAEIVDHDFFSLATIAQGPEPVRHGLNSAQRSVLRQPGPLTTVFFLLASGWTTAQIEREIGGGVTLEPILDRLESLDLVHRRAGHTVRVLVRPDIREHAYGEMRDLALTATQQFLSGFNLQDPDCEWKLVPARLSPASVLQLKQLIANFNSDIAALSKKDMAQPPELTEWYEVFTGVRLTGREELLQKFK